MGIKNLLGSFIDESTASVLKTTQEAMGVANAVGAFAAGTDADKLELTNVDDMDYGAFTRSSLIDVLSEKATIYEQILPLNKLVANRLTPFLPGRAYFIPVYMPLFCEMKQPTKTAFIKKLITSMLTGFQGIQDLTVEKATVATGSAAHDYDVVIGMTGDTKEVTLSFPTDLDGQPIRKFLNYWATGIYDRYSTLGHYYGAPIPWGQGNHTMSGVYFVLDVKGRMCQYAAYVTNMFPNMIPESMNNYKKGEHNPIALEIPMSCQFISNHPYATELANHYISIINTRVAAITSRYRIDLMEEIEEKGLQETYSSKAG